MKEVTKEAKEITTLIADIKELVMSGRSWFAHEVELFDPGEGHLLELVFYHPEKYRTAVAFENEKDLKKIWHYVKSTLNISAEKWQQNYEYGLVAILLAGGVTTFLTALSILAIVLLDIPEVVPWWFLAPIFTLIYGLFWVPRKETRWAWHYYRSR